MAPLEDRLTALCEQPSPVVTGIDFIQVVEPHVQTRLRVFFIIDPDTLVGPMVATASLPAPLLLQQVEITSASGGTQPEHVPVASATWRKFTTPSGATRTVLEIETTEPGGFSDYVLTIHDPPANRIDRFFNGVRFSFKQGCPSVFDCRHERACPPEDEVDVPVDYLARDFESLRHALLDFAAQRYPLWHERIPADAATMLQEILAALGDELAYVQDRIAREGTLETLAERRSLRWHTQLVDYTLDDGESARTWIDIQVAPGAQQGVASGTRVWATPAGEDPIPYEIGLGLSADATSFWVSDAWNALQVHVPDPAAPCLQAGATELFLVGAHPHPASVPPGSTAAPWLGRTMLLQSDPLDPAEPRRRHLVQLTEVEVTNDPLVQVNGSALDITRIAWRTEDALPFDLCLADTTLHGNLVPATAGETFTETFAVGPAGSPEIAVTVARQGPLDAETRRRPTIQRYSLAQTELRGLGRIAGVPEVILDEIPPSPATERRWSWRASPIDATPTDATFTLDDGTWRSVISFDRPGGRIEHVDRASGRGMTIRFGDGEFGRNPPAGTEFRVRYRTDVGTRPNLPADSVTVLADPRPTSATTPTLVGVASKITNPFAITSGRAPEDAAVVKQIAPEAYQQNLRRAVRDEDYRALAERLPWIQRAGANARWTGSWLSEMVSVDPRGTTTLAAERRSALEHEMDCVRQAGRPVVVRDPVYRPLDLRIRICVQPSAHPGRVIESVLDALVGQRRAGRPLPFFDPDNFSFGDALYRASLEAAVQAVPGVLAVEDVRLRVRGSFDWRSFEGFVLDAGDDQILRLDNDPDHPEAGSLYVTTEALA